MKRAVLKLLLAAMLLAPVAAHAISDPSEMLANPKLEARAEALGRRLRCLVCQNESIEESSAGLAQDLRALVRRHIMRGESDKQIIAFLVARYGNFVRLDPPFDPATWLLWGSPVVAIVAGLGVVAFRVVRRVPPAAPAPLDQAERDRLARLLADNAGS
ncbi:MAG: cytochrome c-type biogenesis protein CcmH [Rhodospirillales bacterium]|nr:cytochrome c-type biogenesis protein CcmH [Rhodospirillales bacterium]